MTFSYDRVLVAIQHVGQSIKETVAPEETVPAGVATGLRGFLGKFTVLKGAQRELWLTFLIKFLIYTAYSVTNKTMVLWLSKDLGFSDQAAGALVGWVWAPAMTVFTLLAGSITDAIGLRRTFFLGVAICTVARSVMVVTTIPSLALACGVLPLAIGEALGTPVLLAATRRYSTVAQRSISFSIIYMIMNVGYIAAGWIFDYVRQFNFHVSLFGFEPSSYQQLFMVSLAFEIVLFPVIYFLRRGAEAANGGPVINPSSRNAEAGRNFLSGIWETVRRSATESARLFGRLIGQSGFYRLLLFFLFIGFLKAIFLQMDYVFPKFGIRELGVNAPVGKLSAINAIVIIMLVPFVGALTQKFAAYRMVVIGGVICSAGVFIMALPTEWFQAAANGVFGQWLGHAYLGLQGKSSPLLRHVGAVSHCFLDRRSLLLTTRVRVCRCYCPAGTGSIIRFAGIPSISRGQTARWHRRLVAGRICSRARSTRPRHDVADFCFGGIGRTDWVDCIPPLHSRSGGRAAGYAIARSALKRPTPNVQRLSQIIIASDGMVSAPFRNSTFSVRRFLPNQAAGQRKNLARDW